MQARRASMPAASLQPHLVRILPMRGVAHHYYHGYLQTAANPSPGDVTHCCAAGGEGLAVQRDGVGLGNTHPALMVHAQPELDPRTGPVANADISVLNPERITVAEFAQPLNRPHGMLGGFPASLLLASSLELLTSCRPPVRR